jgi:hypothetical protein
MGDQLMSIDDDEVEYDPDDDEDELDDDELDESDELPEDNDPDEIPEDPDQANPRIHDEYEVPIFPGDIEEGMIVTPTGPDTEEETS